MGRRSVITGGPGNGKTSTCFEFYKMGMWLCPEAARPVIEEQLALEPEGILPWKDDDEIFRQFQLLVLERQLKTERAVSRELDIFLDRGIADNVGYCNLRGISVPRILDAYARTRVYEYDRVFLLEPLPDELYENDSERRESLELAHSIHEAIRHAYTTYMYNVISIPSIIDGRLLSKKERAELVLSHI